jgi:hypothetical protein
MSLDQNAEAGRSLQAMIMPCRLSLLSLFQ